MPGHGRSSLPVYVNRPAHNSVSLLHGFYLQPATMFKRAGSGVLSFSSSCSDTAGSLGGIFALKAKHLGWHASHGTLARRVQVGYLSGTLRVVATTCILATGFNLPARRVILHALQQVLLISRAAGTCLCSLSLKLGDSNNHGGCP